MYRGLEYPHRPVSLGLIDARQTQHEAPERQAKSTPDNMASDEGRSFHGIGSCA